MNSAAVALATFGQALIAADKAATETLASKVRTRLATDGAHSMDQLADAMPDVDRRALRKAIDYLRDVDHVTGKKEPGQGVVYSATRAGIAAACIASTGGSVAQPRQVSMGGRYDGAELRHQVVRPGAYDAFALPSIHCGRRIARVVR